MSLSNTDLELPGDSPWNAGPPEVRGTPIRAIDLPGLHDYWAVYERHYDEIRSIVLAELADDSEVGDIIRRTPREVLEQRGRESRELTRAAIFEGQWEPYLENLRSQGSIYANMGLSFAAWFRIIGAFRPHIMRHLLVAFAADTRRLIRAIDGMDHLIDLALSAIGDSYLTAQEDVIAHQREAIGELRSRVRYQVILASIADGVVTTDPKGNVITVNPAMERLAGVAADEAIGRRYEEVYPAIRDGEMLPWEGRYLYRAIQDRETVLSEGTEVDLRRPDGRDVSVSITAAPIIEEGGRLLGAVAVFREAPPAKPRG